MSTMDRTAFIGGTDVAAILGVSPWKSHFLLYQEKIGEYVENILPEQQRRFDRGHRFEPVILDMLVDELQYRGHDVQILRRNGRYYDQECQFMSCEIDAELLVDGVEANADMKSMRDRFAAKDWGEDGTDEIPLRHIAQAMHGMMITHRQQCIFAGLIGLDDLRIHYVKSDEETIAAIRAKEIEFWRRVQERDAPDPTTADDVKWLYAKDEGMVMEADEELLRLCEEIKHGKDIAKQCDARIETLSTRIKLAMGHASTLIYQGRKIASWKSNKESQKTDWQAACMALGATPDHIQKFTKTVAGARPLLIK